MALGSIRRHDEEIFRFFRVTRNKGREYRAVFFLFFVVVVALLLLSSSSFSSSSSSQSSSSSHII